MKLNINKPRFKNLACDLVLISMILDSYNIDIEVGFLDSWIFKYIKNDSNTLLSNRILSREKHRDIIHANLKEYAGFEQKIYKFDDSNQALDFIKHQIDNKNPITFNCDMASLPWCLTDIHAQGHKTMVINYSDNDLICIDGAVPDESRLLLSYENFNKSFLDHCIAYSINKTSINETDLIIKFKNTINNFLQKDTYKSIKLFSDEIKEYLNVFDEIKGYKYWFDSPLMVSLYEISKSREYFNYFFKYLIKKFNLSQFTSFTYKFDELIKNWHIVPDSLLKCFLKKNITISDLKIISDYINRNAEEEKKIAQNIIELF